MSVIVDTSVWSLALRRQAPEPSLATSALAQVINDGRAVMLGAIRQEILSGIRHVEQFDRLREALSAFPDEPVDSEDYIKAASICNQCVDAGIQIGNTDALICAVALTRGMEILSTDRDFEHVSTVVPIRLHLRG